MTIFAMVMIFALRPAKEEEAQALQAHQARREGEGEDDGY